MAYVERSLSLTGPRTQLSRSKYRLSKYRENARKDERIMEINEVRISLGTLFAPISIDDFIKAQRQNNPTEDMKEYRAAS